MEGGGGREERKLREEDKETSNGKILTLLTTSFPCTTHQHSTNLSTFPEHI